MSTPGADHRSANQRERDERIADEPPMAPPQLPSDAKPSPVEDHLDRMSDTRPRPIAVAGVVENGLVRPLDSAVKLRDKARVIIVTSEAE